MAEVDRPRFISELDARFASRLVYDVLMFTLEKCGFPDVRRIATTLQPNVYGRPDFVQIAGVCSLRIALINRDSWRQMFISRHNSSGLVGLDIPLFISQIVKVSVFGRGKSLQSDVQTMLALCNEITLFFFSKQLKYDINNVIGSIGGSIFFLLRSYPNYRDALEGLFDKFANLQEYTKFLSNFAKKYAVPYGSREDVSDLFYQELRKRRINYVAKRRCQQEPSIKQLVDHLGFLPLNLYSKIKAEESEKYPEHLEEAVAAIPAAAGESLNPSTLPKSSETGAVGGQTSRRRHSTESMKQSEEQRSSKNKSGKGQATRSRKDSEQITQPEGLFKKDSTELGLEDELRRLSLGTETTSKESQGESFNPLTLPTSSESGAIGGQTSRRRHLTESMKQSEEHKSGLFDEPPKSHASSESGKKKSGKGQATQSRKDSEQTTGPQQREKDSSELGLEDQLGQLSLGTETTSQESQGAIPKRSQSSKDKKSVKK